MHQPHLFLDSN